jgi:hypothetical protein
MCKKIVPGISTATMVPVYPASGIPKVGQQQFIMVTSAPSIATTTKTNIPRNLYFYFQFAIKYSAISKNLTVWFA